MADRDIDQLPLATVVNTVDNFHLRQSGTDKKLPASSLIALLPPGPTGPAGPTGPQGPPTSDYVKTDPDGNENVITPGSDASSLRLSPFSSDQESPVLQIDSGTDSGAAAEFFSDGAHTMLDVPTYKSLADTIVGFGVIDGDGKLEKLTTLVSSLVIAIITGLIKPFDPEKEFGYDLGDNVTDDAGIIYVSKKTANTDALSVTASWFVTTDLGDNLSALWKSALS